jgi:hypothetical protein
MQKSTTFTRILRVKKCYFQYDFACKKVPLSLRYAKKYVFSFHTGDTNPYFFYLTLLVLYEEQFVLIGHI